MWGFHVLDVSDPLQVKNIYEFDLEGDLDKIM